MTTGQLVFYSGVGLLALTLLLAVVFAVKKPRYDPEAAGLGGPGRSTQKLRSGYPTDPLTIRREPPAKAGAETERLPEAGTAVLPETETEPLPGGPAQSATLLLGAEDQPATARLAGEAEQPLGAETAVLPPEEGTLPLKEGTVPLEEGTRPLPPVGGP